MKKMGPTAAAAAEAPQPVEPAVPVSGKEVCDSFAVFISEHANQQKALYDQMLGSIREMYEAPGESVRGKNRKLAANRVSLVSLTNLGLYLTAHQRLVSSLIADIADGKIGKKSRRASDARPKKAVPEEEAPKKRKLEKEEEVEAPRVAESETKSQKMIDRAASLLRRLENK